MRRLAVLAVGASVALAAARCPAQATRPAPGATRPAAAPARPAPPGAAPVTLLDTFSVWRTFHVLRPPVIQFDEGPKPVLTPMDWLNRDTPPVPADWTKPDFDDTAWLRGTAKAFARTPYLARLCQRARFEVTDPSAVKDLKLSLWYYGGVIVYVNGRELVRGSLARDGAPDLADAYPLEAFVTDDGKLMPGGWVVERYKKQMGLRERALTDVAVPADLLRRGVNVIAIETVRAPYHKVIDEKKTDPAASRDTAGRGCPYELSWGTCETRKVALVSGSEAGIVPNAARPGEMQAWNGEFLTPDYESDQGDRCEPLRPVTIKAVRNGWASGKVVLGSPRAIEGLKVACGELRQGAAAIPASAVRVRYAASWGGGYLEGYSAGTRYGARLLDALLETPPDAFQPGQFGAVVPIWLTVKVPADARPGLYKGELAISAKDEKPLLVPVNLEVAGWFAPDAKDYRTWVELIQSPDTLALEYNVPLWSEEHMKLIGRSLRYVGEIGSRVAYVPLICNTNSGNEESMVRWIRRPDGAYDFDFSVMDRYLDLVQKGLGEPLFTVFTAWEIYLSAPKQPTPIEVKGAEGSWEWVESRAARSRQEWKGKGPVVTVLEPATGKTDKLVLPRFEEPGAKELWKPLFDEIRKRMEKRGLAKSMALGMSADIWPTKEEVAVLHEVSGGLPWVRHTHGGNSVGQKMHGIGVIEYTAYVWNVEYAPDPAKGRLYGWKEPGLVAQYRRGGALNHMSLASILHYEELNITGRQRGVGRIGADMWPVIRDKKGQRAGYVADRYPQSYWHSLNLASHLLVPGPAGPVASVRYEVFREGIQECEARIAIETALTDEAMKARLGPELANRCQEVLDQRLRDLWRAGSGLNLYGRDYASAKLHGDAYGGGAGHFWFASSGWQERTALLYSLAEEVASKTARK